MVSVIVPNYNHEIFLKQRIDSILNQSYQDFELIILDDCSTDNSKAIIEQYRGNSKVSQIIYNENNSGTTFKQWNKAVDLAAGDIIWLAESDDTADTNFLQTLLPYFDLKHQIGIVYCQSYRINDKNEITGSWLTHTETFNKSFDNNFEMDGTEYIKNYLINFNTIPNASAVLFRKEYYQNIGGTDIDIKYCSDWLTWIKILLISNVIFIAKPLNYFRYHNKSVIAVAGKKFKTDIYHEFYDKIMRINLCRYLKGKINQNAEYKNIYIKNKRCIQEIIGREGVFDFTNKRKTKGIVSLIKVSSKLLTLTYFKIIAIHYYNRYLKKQLN